MYIMIKMQTALFSDFTLTEAHSHFAAVLVEPEEHAAAEYIIFHVQRLG